MELITYILYQLAAMSMTMIMATSTLAIFGFILGIFLIKAIVLSGQLTDGNRSIGGRIRMYLVSILYVIGYAAIIFLFIFSIGNLIFPHMLDGKLMNSVGKRTVGRVTRVEQTSNMLNYRPVMRHYVIYKDEAGNNIETEFETWDFNIYPSTNSFSYPGKGQKFGVLYLPSYPTTFLILADEDSDLGRKKECRDILNDLEEAKQKFEFDPSDPAFSKALQEAIIKAAEAGCSTQ